MSDPFLGEVRMMSFSYPPRGWAGCNGQLLQINQNQALFSLLGTMYGGNGQTTFALPDLRGRMPIHVGAGFTQGQAAGEVNHTLTIQELPQHDHLMTGDAALGAADPTPSSRLADSAGAQLWGPANNLTAMNAGSISQAGGSQPHSNMQPYGVISFCIALQGIFPSRN